jgi:hypothetical protein
MALRNEIDVGHVDLGIGALDGEQLKIVHGYTRRAETAFKALIQKILVGVETGTLIIKQYARGTNEDTAAKVVRRMSQFADEYAL